AAEGQVFAPFLVVDLDDGPACTQRWVVREFLHREHRCAGNVELAKYVDRLELGLVRKPLLDRSEDPVDVGLTRLGRLVLGIVDPFGLADGTADRFSRVSL